MNTIDWLGFPAPFNVAPPTATIGAILDRFLTPDGAAEARERTTMRIDQTATGLRVHAECYTAAMERVGAIQRDYGRDNWGDDALEIQIDVGRTQHWMQRAGTGLAASGTVTVEAAILGLPLVVAWVALMAAWAASPAQKPKKRLSCSTSGRAYNGRSLPSGSRFKRKSSASR